MRYARLNLISMDLIALTQGSKNVEYQLFVQFSTAIALSEKISGMASDVI